MFSVSLRPCKLSIRDVASFVSITLGLLASVICAQTPAILNEVPDKAKEEVWFGWIELPKQHLRSFVRVQHDTTGKVVGASIVIADESPAAHELTEFKKVDGKINFHLVRKDDKQTILAFEGEVESDQLVVGELTLHAVKMPFQLVRTQESPADSRATMDADSVWMGSTQKDGKEIQYRMRAYTTAPYATAEKPKILFDFLSEKRIGSPTTVSTVGERATFDIETPSQKTKFIATLSEDQTELSGSLGESVSSIVPLTMKLVIQKDKLNSVREKRLAQEADLAAKNDSQAKNQGEPSGGQNRNAKSPGESGKSAGAAESMGPKLTSTSFYEEKRFDITYGGSKVRTKRNPAGTPGQRISGVLTLPRNNEASSRRYPAVVLIAGDGPQDHNLNRGKHSTFSELAHFLAEIGIASVRYDSRGVGLSSGEFYLSTLEDTARDAIAVWEQMRQIDQIDPLRIGIVAFSEGGVVGTMAASWESRIAFLILLSPPGLTGSEVSKQQIDRISELQGMSDENREATNALQSELQSLASGYVSNDESTRIAIRDRINDRWEVLQKIALAQDPKADIQAIKEGLILDIENRFQQLRQPWYQSYFKHDPTVYWMLVRQPILALWGEKDCEVLPEPNAMAIDNCTKRNSKLDVTLEVLPDLNHRLQSCKSGLPDEYEEISEALSPSALGRIRMWFEIHGLIGRR